MALSTARIHRVRGRPPLLAAGITSLIHSHSSSVRSLGYIFSFIYPFYTTREDFSDRLSVGRGTSPLFTEGHRVPNMGSKRLTGYDPACIVPQLRLSGPREAKERAEYCD